MNFAQFAQAHGLLIKDLYPGQRIRRCATQSHPHKRNGAYLYTGDRGWCQDWSTGEPVQWWNDENAKPWSDDEKKAWAARQRAAEKARQQAYAKAARDAEKLLSECSIDSHPYLKSKQLPHVRGMIAADGAAMIHPDGYSIPIGGALLIPMRDSETNQLVGLQAIKWDPDTEIFQKLFLPGMRAKGAIYRIGSGKESILCEGYATGQSIAEAIQRLKFNTSVMCCFSASNIVQVAKTKGDFVMADHDRQKKEDKLPAGQQAAIDTGLPWLMPDTVGEDWNDVYSSEGIMAVCKAVMQVRKTRAVG